MTQFQIEIEAKFLCTEQEYNTLLSYMNNPESKLYKTHYYDTARWDLYQQEAALRISDGLLTLKTALRSDSDIKHSSELSEEFCGLPGPLLNTRYISAQMHTEFEKRNIRSPFELKGSLVKHRTEGSLPESGGSVELDRVRIPCDNSVFWEVEIECADPAILKLSIAEVRAVCPGIKQHTRSKLEALYQSLKKR